MVKKKKKMEEKRSSGHFLRTRNQFHARDKSSGNSKPKLNELIELKLNKPVHDSWQSLSLLSQEYFNVVDSPVNSALPLIDRYKLLKQKRARGLFNRTLSPFKKTQHLFKNAARSSAKPANEWICENSSVIPHKVSAKNKLSFTAEDCDDEEIISMPKDKTKNNKSIFNVKKTLFPCERNYKNDLVNLSCRLTSPMDLTNCTNCDSPNFQTSSVILETSKLLKSNSKQNFLDDFNKGLKEKVPSSSEVVNSSVSPRKIKYFFNLQLESTYNSGKILNHTIQNTESSTEIFQQSSLCEGEISNDTDVLSSEFKTVESDKEDKTDDLVENKRGHANDHVENVRGNTNDCVPNYNLDENEREDSNGYVTNNDVRNERRNSNDDVLENETENTSICVTNYVENDKKDTNDDVDNEREDAIINLAENEREDTTYDDVGNEREDKNDDEVETQSEATTDDVGNERENTNDDEVETQSENTTDDVGNERENTNDDEWENQSEDTIDDVVGNEKENANDDEVVNGSEDTNDDVVENQREGTTDDEVENQREDTTDDELENQREDKNNDEVEKQREDKNNDEVENQSEDITDDVVGNERENTNDCVPNNRLVKLPKDGSLVISTKTSEFFSPTNKDTSVFMPEQSSKKVYGGNDSLTDFTNTDSSHKNGEHSKIEEKIYKQSKHSNDVKNNICLDSSIEKRCRNKIQSSPISNSKTPIQSPKLKNSPDKKTALSEDIIINRYSLRSQSKVSPSKNEVRVSTDNFESLKNSFINSGYNLRKRSFPASDDLLSKVCRKLNMSDNVNSSLENSSEKDKIVLPENSGDAESTSATVMLLAINKIICEHPDSRGETEQTCDTVEPDKDSNCSLDKNLQLNTSKDEKIPPELSEKSLDAGQETNISNISLESNLSEKSSNHCIDEQSINDLSFADDVSSSLSETSTGQINLKENVSPDIDDNVQSPLSSNNICENNSSSKLIEQNVDIPVVQTEKECVNENVTNFRDSLDCGNKIVPSKLNSTQEPKINSQLHLKSNDEQSRKLIVTVGDYDIDVRKIVKRVYLKWQLPLQMLRKVRKVEAELLLNNDEMFSKLKSKSRASANARRKIDPDDCTSMKRRWIQFCKLYGFDRRRPKYFFINPVSKQEFSPIFVKYFSAFITQDFKVNLNQQAAVRCFQSIYEVETLNRPYTDYDDAVIMALHKKLSADANITRYSNHIAASELQRKLNSVIMRRLILCKHSSSPIKKPVSEQRKVKKIRLSSSKLKPISCDDTLKENDNIPDVCPISPQLSTPETIGYDEKNNEEILTKNDESSSLELRIGILRQKSEKWILMLDKMLEISGYTRQTIEKLESIDLSVKDWRIISCDIGLSPHVAKAIFQTKIHPLLFSCPSLNKYQLIKNITDFIKTQGYTCWNDIKWSEMSKSLFGLKPLCLYITFVDFVKIHVPPDYQQSFKDCISYLSNLKQSVDKDKNEEEAI